METTNNSLSPEKKKDSDSLKVLFLTTKDNPFNPFTQFDEWFQFDVSNGYNSSGLLARIAKTSDSLSDKRNNEEIRNAIAWIEANDPTGNYKGVSILDFN